MKPTLTKRIKHRLEWLLVWAGFGFFKLLPLQMASNLAASIARAIGPKMKVSNVARRNLKAAFPEWNDAKIEETVIGVWDNLGRYAAEFPHIAKMSGKKFNEICEIVGVENLVKNETGGTGSLVFSCHMANWEAGVKATKLAGYPLSIVYRPLNNPYVEKLVNRYRDHYQEMGLPKTNAGGRELIKTIKDGGGVGILIDQKMNTGLPIPFFGRNCMTTTSIADLSIRYNCPIIPARVERIGRKAKFRVTVYPPLKVALNGNRESDAQAIMGEAHRHLEEWISERPDQWFWLHKRWG